MAHTVTAIDLGAHTIKCVVIEVGFRQSHIAQAFEENVPPGTEPLIERQGLAIRAALSHLPSESTVYMALPGEMLAIRVLDLPFADARKVDQVIAYELEAQIVHALEDVTFDHALLQLPGSNEGSSVLAVAAKIEDIAKFLADVGTAGVEPRALYAAPTVYQTLFADAAPVEGVVPAARVLIDVGHQHTNVCVLWQGETIFARTISRGGAALTAALARSLECDEQQAEAIKLEHGFVASVHRPPATPAAARVDGILREALLPLVRELRQTLAGIRSNAKTPLESVLLTGGGALLPGLKEYLEQELELPVTLWGPASEPNGGDLSVEMPIAAGGAVPDTRFSLATAIGWAGARGEKQIDLRRGPFTFKANLSVLRQKAFHVAVLVAAIVVAGTVDATMNMARLGKQRDQLEKQLKSATQELFGEQRKDAREVTAMLKKGFKDEMAPIPKATAFDLLDQISRKVPSAEQMKLDVQELDIKSKKVFIKGIASSAAAVDDMVAKLKEIDCFSDITKGSITEVTGGGKQFSLTIGSTCP